MTKHLYIDEYGLFVGKTIPIKATDGDKAEVKNTVSEIIRMIEIGRLPYSSADDGKCTQCEFLNYCNDRF